MVVGQFVNGFAYGALADPVAGGELHLAGNGLPRLPLARLQALQNQALDLLVERTESGRDDRGFLQGCLGVGLRR